MTQASVIQPRQELVESDDTSERYEIVDGERRELQPMGVFETGLASRLVTFLQAAADRRLLGLTVTETLFIINAARKLNRRPDVAFVSYGRWPERNLPRANAWNVTPDLAVEIVSPTNLAEEIDTKIVEYFEAGVQLVWVIYPDTGRVYVFESPNHASILNRSQELDGGDVLPDFRLPIERLFESVTKPT